MSNVDFSAVTYPYIKIKLRNDSFTPIENVGTNLSLLYLYIDRYKNMGRTFKYGNAYKAIKERANQLIGARGFKISKRQVASLRKVYSILGTDQYVKIPYSAYFIFKAIFEITDELKTKYPFPDDLNAFVGKIRRNIFYWEQTQLLHQWNEGNTNTLNRELADDL